MAGASVTISTDGGTFAAYSVKAAAASAPTVVVIQEIFGVNQVMRDICEDLAGQGYNAISPDLFWRIEPGIELTDKTDAEWARAFELFKAFDVDAGVRDIQATITHARGMAGSNGKVGAVGYCLGGLLAFLTAARTDVDAAVGYYGVGIQDRLGEADGITKPLMLHIAGKDEFVPPAAQQKVTDGLSGHSQVTLHHYPEMDHAFARIGGAHYDKGNADTANSRTKAFLDAALQ